MFSACAPCRWRRASSVLSVGTVHRANGEAVRFVVAGVGQQTILARLVEGPCSALIRLFSFVSARPPHITSDRVRCRDRPSLAGYPAKNGQVFRGDREQVVDGVAHNLARSVYRVVFLECTSPAVATSIAEFALTLGTNGWIWSLTLQ